MSLKSKIRSLILNVYLSINAFTQLNLHEKLEELQARPRYKDPKSLIPHGYKVYSQCEEDGMIAEIFERIGTTNKVFVEFGIGDGLENNSLTLLFQDWKGLWIEGSENAVSNIHKYFAPIIERGDLKIENAFITKDTIDGLISDNISDKEIDLLSVDIDGNDWYVFDAIKTLSARVIVFEYNAKFMPPLRFCMDYDAEYVRKGDDCFGVSLQFITDAMEPKGYSLVGCNLSGANAFFVRNDLLGDKFEAPYTAKYHFEPARYYLTQFASGHPASYQSLARSMSMRHKS